eukprot:Skav213305  [mRNA]  locus=scaffold2480:634732:641213:- [translate_table: standard]
MAGKDKERAFSRQHSEDTGGNANKAAETKSDAGRLVQKEEAQVGSVSGRVYVAYIQAAGGWCLAITVVLGVLIGQGRLEAAVYKPWRVDGSPTGIPGHLLHECREAFLGIFFTSALFRLTALKAARKFHKNLLENMLRLPMNFFDTTPQGRVLNRFSKDVNTIDEVCAAVVCTMVVIATATPWFLVVPGHQHR